MIFLCNNKVRTTMLMDNTADILLDNIMRVMS